MKLFARGTVLSLGLLVAAGSAATVAPAAEQGVYPGEPVRVQLYPAPKRYRMGGIPPGMTAQSFLAGRGTMTVTPLGERHTRLEFDFSGLIPNGVYTLWNVLTPLPEFSDEPLGPEGYGRHGVIADADGSARAVIYLDGRPGEMFLLDYHADGELTGEKREVVFPGALWAPFPDLGAEEG